MLERLHREIGQEEEGDELKRVFHAVEQDIDKHSITSRATVNLPVALYPTFKLGFHEFVFI